MLPTLQARETLHLVVDLGRRNCGIDVLPRCAMTLEVDPHSVHGNLSGSRAWPGHEA